jgi:hypothetical protein
MCTPGAPGVARPARSPPGVACADTGAKLPAGLAAGARLRPAGHAPPGPATGADSDPERDAPLGSAPLGRPVPAAAVPRVVAASGTHAAGTPVIRSHPTPGSISLISQVAPHPAPWASSTHRWVRCGRLAHSPSSTCGLPQTGQTRVPGTGGASRTQACEAATCGPVCHIHRKHRMQTPQGLGSGSVQSHDVPTAPSSAADACTSIR